MNDPIKHSEITFQLMVESAPNALLLINKEGKIAFVNEQTQKLFGYSRKELTGKPVELLVPSRFATSHPGFRNMFLDSPETKAMGAGRNLFALRKDGTELPVEIGLNPLITVDGTMVLVTVIDITERKKFEEKQALAASIVNSSDDAIISKDLTGLITSWNTGAQKIFGYSPREIIGKHISILIPDELQNEEKEIMEKIKRGEDIDHYETIRLGKNEDIVCVSLTISPIKDSAGNIIGASKISRDITEAKRIAEEMQKKSHQIETIFARITDGFISFDTNWNCAYINKSGGAMLGRNPEDLLGKNMWAEFPEAVGGTSYKSYHEALSTQKHIHFEEYYEPLKAHFEGNIYPSPDGVSVFFKDITERKKAENELLKANRLYAFLSAINQSIVHVKEESTLLDAARLIAMETGRFKLARIGMLDETGVLTITNEEDNKGLSVGLQRAYKMDFRKPPFSETPTGKVISTGRYYVSNDAINDPDLTYWREEMITDGIRSCASFPIKKSGKLSGVFSFLSAEKDFFDEKEISLLDEAVGDISFAIELFEKEKAHKQAQEERNMFFDIAVDMLCIATTDGYFKTVNPAFEETLDYTQPELLAVPFMDFVHPDDVGSTAQQIEKLASGIRGINFNNRFLCKDGSYKWLEWNARPVGTSLYASARDVTERRKAENEIATLNESLERKVKERTSELQEANRELETFNYTVTHDLQSPLRSLMGFSKILLNDYHDKLDTQGKEFLNIIGGSAGRMNELIKDLLHFSKMGKNPMRKKTVDMDELASIVISEIKIGSEKLNAEIKLLNIKPCFCDPGLMKQVWANLIGNAVKYSSKVEKPVIEIGMKQLNDEVVYYVKDNGAGFEMKYADKLFAVFHRLHKATEFEGTGVGLATVQRIITRHGGRIWAEAKKGEGATFYFTLSEKA